MNIQEAKKEICNTLRAYLAKDENGYYIYPLVRQRPILLIGPPGIGKTAIMEQAASECGVGLVSYTITHHTRQSAIGLPEIVKRNYGGKGMMVTDYTMSEIVASVYDCMEKTGKKRESFLLMRSTAYRKPWHRRCWHFFRIRLLEVIRFRKDGFWWQQVILRSIINR